MDEFQNGKFDIMIGFEMIPGLADKYMYPVVIATHSNTENTHNHFVVGAWDVYGKSKISSARDYCFFKSF